MKNKKEGQVKRLALVFIMVIVLFSGVAGDQVFAARNNRANNGNSNQTPLGSNYVYRGQMNFQNRSHDVYALTPQFTRREISEINSKEEFESMLASKAKFTLINSRTGEITTSLNVVDINDRTYDQLMTQLSATNSAVSKTILVGLEGSRQGRYYYYEITINVSKKTVVTLAKTPTKNKPQTGKPVTSGGKGKAPGTATPTKKTKEKTSGMGTNGNKPGMMTADGYREVTFPTRLGQMMGVIELDDPLLVASVTPMYADNIQAQDEENSFFPGLSGDMTWLVLLQAAVILLILCVIKRKQLKDLLNRKVFNRGE